jgi:hypothetical protein
MKTLTDQQKLEILCAYLPHGVIMYGASDMWTLHELGFTGATLVNQNKQNVSFEDLILNYSPILRHPDDMTEDELMVFASLAGKDKPFFLSLSDDIRYLHSIHIDTFGAIEAGFAVRKQLN